MSETHTERQDLARRLARISGHVLGIRTMIDEERDCAEILQQMSAVLRAVENARRLLLEDHLEHCILAAAQKGRGDEAVRELRKTLKLAWR